MVSPRSRMFCRILAKAKPKPNRKVDYPRTSKGITQALVVSVLAKLARNTEPASAPSRAP